MILNTSELSVGVKKNDSMLTGGESGRGLDIYCNYDKIVLKRICIVRQINDYFVFSAIALGIVWFNLFKQNDFFPCVL